MQKNHKGIRVLSLFDGGSCGQLALQRAGIKVDNYFASEIDKYAIEVADKNFPKTIQLGDVKSIIGAGNIGLLMGGSPCQGFSIAGDGLNFDDPRSALFFEFVRLLKSIKSKYFFLENVMMKQEYQDIITELLGVKPLLVNSSLMSAQNRKRLYWTNIPHPAFKDKGIVISDITDSNTEAKTLPCDEFKTQNQSLCKQVATARVKGHDLLKRVYCQSGKSPTLDTMQGGGREPKILTKEWFYRPLNINEMERLQTLPTNYTDAGISNTQRKKIIGNGWTVDIVAEFFKNIK